MYELKPATCITPDSGVVPIRQLMWRRDGPGVGTHTPHRTPVHDAAGGQVTALIHQSLAAGTARLRDKRCKERKQKEMILQPHARNSPIGDVFSVKEVLEMEVRFLDPHRTPLIIFLGLLSVFYITPPVSEAYIGQCSNTKPKSGPHYILVSYTTPPAPEAYIGQCSHIKLPNQLLVTS